MTVADEARELLRRQRAADDDLTALRREIDEAVAGRGGHIDAAAAEDYRRRLEAAQERKRDCDRAIRALNETG